jgi:FKBP-type peptidyl-prolyl cis-trans isomerase
MRTFLYITISIFLFSCGSKPQKKELTKEQWKKAQEDLVKANIGLKKEESEKIDAYAKNKGWSMTTSPSGLRYQVTQAGKGANAKPGQFAKVNYKIWLTDGTLCYSSEKDGPKEFKVGEDYVESGLHEGIQLMNTGSKAIFILPSYLAHGLTGDNDKIPPLSTVVYEVELLSLRDK